ncbi:DUF1801 domain-containing protein [Pedobacter montanisoli]|uniref:DUF1801 domain-containing protein n=1 Tax=Pedobacter montanisoli TaxID=2923277 RepID=A0ABS9ZYV4_9SPHI|nr:DUF1801 domain-containing protein [Pedobacter montanisoli]MCJ0743483.1 DUF1801 domain-containing protein [Pedobacter montanisoli]
MTKVKLTDTEQVTAHIAQLPTDLQLAVMYLRNAILSVDQTIAEHIKWNSPAFYYSGEMRGFDPKEYKRDILVMNLRKDKIMCVLPTGAVIQHHTEILEGNYTDGRRMIYFKDLADIKEKELQLRKAIQEWLSLVEK